MNVTFLSAGQKAALCCYTVGRKSDTDATATAGRRGKTERPPGKII